jgi:hypothetical protein
MTPHGPITKPSPKAFNTPFSLYLIWLTPNRRNYPTYYWVGLQNILFMKKQVGGEGVGPLPPLGNILLCDFFKNNDLGLQNILNQVSYIPF